MPETELRHPPRRELGGKIRELGRERLRVVGQVEENVAVPHVRVHPVQRVFLLAEVRHFLHVRRADQAAFEVIRPRVVGTLDAPGERAFVFRAQLRAAMPAHVVERMHTA